MATAAAKLKTNKRVYKIYPNWDVFSLVFIIIHPAIICQCIRFLIFTKLHVKNKEKDITILTSQFEKKCNVNISGVLPF